MTCRIYPTSLSVVYLEPSGKWAVMSGDTVLAEFGTNREAWRDVDRRQNTPLNRQQAVSDWIFEQQVHDG